jgi:BirA family biotin operon repressor/biotin-[acetyl-CoA-carboxylase] ligase
VPEPIRIWTIRRFAELDSTNRRLLDDARSGMADGAVTVADHQTAGRGRLDRTWEAAPGSSLLVSVLLRPRLDATRTHVVVMAAALALRDAVTEVAGFTPELKWPNDLVVGDRKLAGLLAERDGDAVVVGAGLNVRADAFGPDLAPIATACETEAGAAVDRDAVLDRFLDVLGQRLDDLDAVLVDYRAGLGTLGRAVRVETAAATVTGTAVDVHDDGALVVRADDGTEHVVTTGDVTQLR